MKSTLIFLIAAIASKNSSENRYDSSSVSFHGSAYNPNGQPNYDNHYKSRRSHYETSYSHRPIKQTSGSCETNGELWCSEDDLSKFYTCNYGEVLPRDCGSRTRCGSEGSSVWCQ